MKFKKHQRIRIFIEQKVKSNHQFLNMNDSPESDYMKGVNSFAKELLTYIKQLEDEK